SQEQLVSQQGQAISELRDAVSMLAHQFEDYGSRVERLENRRTPTPEIPRATTEALHGGQFAFSAALCCARVSASTYSQRRRNPREAKPSLRSSFPDFIAAFRRVFHHPVRGREAEGRLLERRQGTQSVADYSITFRILAAQSGYDDRALCGLLRRGLNTQLKDELATRDNRSNLEELIDITLVLDNRIRERSRERAGGWFPYRHAAFRGASRETTRTSGSGDHSSTRNTAAVDEPMQLGGEHLEPEDRWRRIQDRTYFHCGQQGHRVATCPRTSKPPTPLDDCELRPRIEHREPRRVESSSGLSKRLELEGEIYGPSQVLPIRALVDSGADDCFIDTKKRVHDLDGRLLAVVKKITGPVQLKLSGNHVEHRRFYLMQSRAVPVILGLPWLKTHNPVILWDRPAIEIWSPFCYEHCLRSTVGGHVRSRNEPPETICLDGVPGCYHDLQQVFSKDRAQSLPPHRPYDCAIDLQAGAPLPSSRLYQVSHPEQKALREYINSSLAAGLIRPSRSPLGAVFFFIKKKDESLRPCVDYRGLNEITIKNKYPLPLLDSAFAPLQSATIFKIKFTQCVSSGSHSGRG
uniref:Peptidase A2 domain-containing protein n=1 Tax=Hippocampus comes TaxID=109280 RepID=A0A3Q2XTT7_HIPCM